MGKKGISAEEKRERLLAWCREHKTFVSLKEIEKGGSKATGISSMVMKDVLTQLTVRCPCNKSQKHPPRLARRHVVAPATWYPALFTWEPLRAPAIPAAPPVRRK